MSVPICKHNPLNKYMHLINKNMQYELAKDAARNCSSPDNQLPKLFCSRRPLLHSKSALKQTHKAVLKAVTSTMFENSPQYAAQRCIDPSIPSLKFQSLIQGLPCCHASLLMQLRAGHAPLNKHLHHIGCIDSPICPACEEAQETVLHLLISCPAYKQHCQILRYSLKCDGLDLHNLLSKQTSLKPLFKFLASTHHFKDTYGNITFAKEDRRRRWR